jgi:hypothetical protein
MISLCFLNASQLYRKGNSDLDFEKPKMKKASPIKKTYPLKKEKKSFWQKHKNTLIITSIGSIFISVLLYQLFKLTAQIKDLNAIIIDMKVEQTSEKRHRLIFTEAFDKVYTYLILKALTFKEEGILKIRTPNDAKTLDNLSLLIGSENNQHRSEIQTTIYATFSQLLPEQLTALPRCYIEAIRRADFSIRNPS